MMENGSLDYKNKDKTASKLQVEDSLTASDKGEGDDEYISKLVRLVGRCKVEGRADAELLSASYYLYESGTLEVLMWYGIAVGRGPREFKGPKAVFKEDAGVVRPWGIVPPTKHAEENKKNKRKPSTDKSRSGKPKR